MAVEKLVQLVSVLLLPVRRERMLDFNSPLDLHSHQEDGVSNIEFNLATALLKLFELLNPCPMDLLVVPLDTLAGQNAPAIGFNGLWRGQQLRDCRANDILIAAAVDIARDWVPFKYFGLLTLGDWPINEAHLLLESFGKALLAEDHL